MLSIFENLQQHYNFGNIIIIIIITITVKFTHFNLYMINSQIS